MSKENDMNTRKMILTTILAVTMILAATACAGMMITHARGAKVPATGEFGTGPRTSANGLYTVTLQGAEKLAARKMYTLQAVVVTGADPRPVADATITIDGGMPQHGHGLPTRPRVTKNLGGGAYEISGLRFNMGGWWELKLTITSAAGTDTVTFNLQV
jgi:hypothetical protein